MTQLAIARVQKGNRELQMKATQRKYIHPYERLCPHCDQTVAYKTYKAHKRTFYNRITGSWIKKEKAVEVDHQAPSSDDEIKNSQNEDDSPPHSDPELDLECQMGFDETPPLSDPALSDASNSDINGIFLQ